MAQQAVGLNLAPFYPLARTPAQLAERLSLLFTANAMPKASLDRITAAINALPAGNGTATAADIERVRSAIYLVLTSPFGATQK